MKQKPYFDNTLETNNKQWIVIYKGWTTITKFTYH